MTQFVARNGLIALNDSIVTGSLNVTERIVAQSVSSSFSGSGANLYDIPASGIVGLNLSQISSGSVSASISPNNGLQVNIGVTAPSFSGSFSGSGANLSNIPASGIVGLNLSQISSGSYSASISEAGLLVNNRVVADSFSGSFSGSGANLSGIPASGIVGLNLSQISSGSVSASISPSTGLQVNTNVTATSFTGSLFGIATGNVISYYQTTAPATGSATPTGSIWINSDTGLAYSHIYDGNSFQWVQATLPLGPQGPQGANGTSTVDSLTTTTFNGLLKGDGATISATTVATELGYTPENVANKETSSLDTSNTKYPSNNLVKTNIDNFADDVDYAIMTNQRILFNF